MRIKAAINACDVLLNLAMNKNQLATAGLMLGGAIALLALDWNASEQPQSKRQSVPSVASGKVMGENDAFRGGRSRHPSQREHLSDDR